jgi:hypothetical protein
VQEGRVYRLRYLPGDGNRWAVLTVTVDVASSGLFEVVEETDDAQLYEKLGVAGELRTGNPEFDADFYVLAPTVNFAREFLESDENRGAIRDLFGEDFVSLRHDGSTLSARLPLTFLDYEYLGPMDDRNAAALKTRLSAAFASLAVLARNLRGMRAADAPRVMRPWRVNRLVVFPFPILLLAVVVWVDLTGSSLFNAVLDRGGFSAHYQVLGRARRTVASGQRLLA